MLFQGRFDRARRLQRRQRGLDAEEGTGEESFEEPFVPERPEERIELERGDLFAMLVAALYTVFLPAFGVLALVVALAWLFFFR